MQEEQLFIEKLQLKLQELRQKLENLKQDNADLETMLELTIDHGDRIMEQLIEANRKLYHQVIEYQKTATTLASQLVSVTKEKADLEILLEATVEHGDTVEQELHNQSIRDPLTGLFNRRYMERCLEREIEEAKRNQQPLFMMMIDIDHFKNFNNTYGHEAGDMVLREVSVFLQTHIRDNDIACRYGGEELTLILPAADLEVSQQQAEQLRQGVKQLSLEYGGQPLTAITFSLGIAYYPQHGLTWEEVLQAADAALYQAKAQGRDRVVVAA